jgi:5-methylcytosine-specific restriction endonuclease McrA
MNSKILQYPTLVLNRNWQPVHVATVARALVLLWNEAAHVVDPDDYQLYTWTDWSKLTPRADEPFIRAVRFRLRVPEVITLTGYDRLPLGAVTFSRRNVFKRDHYTCQYCGRQGRPQLRAADEADDELSKRNTLSHENRPRRQPGSEELTLDHVLPRSQGGVSSWDMQQGRRNLPHTSHCNASALLDGQRMIGRLQFDEGTLVQGPKMNMRLHKAGVRVQRQSSAKPAEVGRLLLSPVVFPQFDDSLEALLAQRNPDAPSK